MDKLEEALSRCSPSFDNKEDEGKFSSSMMTDVPHRVNKYKPAEVAHHPSLLVVVVLPSPLLWGLYFTLVLK